MKLKKLNEQKALEETAKQYFDWVKQAYDHASSEEVWNPSRPIPRKREWTSEAKLVAEFWKARLDEATAILDKITEEEL